MKLNWKHEEKSNEGGYLLARIKIPPLIDAEFEIDFDKSYDKLDDVIIYTVFQTNATLFFTVSKDSSPELIRRGRVETLKKIAQQKVDRFVENVKKSYTLKPAHKRK